MFDPSTDPVLMALYANAVGAELATPYAGPLPQTPYPVYVQSQAEIETLHHFFGPRFDMVELVGLPWHAMSNSPGDSGA
jgi:hypothetical protein